MGRSKKNKTEDKRVKFKSLMKIIAGVDEVGRGSLIGPVYAAAVILNKSVNSNILKDSKTLTKEKREILFKYIKKNSIWATGKASVKEIDKIIRNKQAIYDLTVDKKVNKIGEGSKLEKFPIDKLPKFLQDNLNNYKEWID